MTTLDFGFRRRRNREENVAVCSWPPISGRLPCSGEKLNCRNEIEEEKRTFAEDGNAKAKQR
jgi:hypothetical protein